jgi:2-polyprenyl-6-methoxyphenol hydroxylase-like FAD-dependent oxidoreductase
MSFSRNCSFGSGNRLPPTLPISIGLMESTHLAVVIGASIGGLFAARALADTYDRVLLIDRDVLPDQPGPRKAVPQARHLHALLAGGLAAMEDLLPGLTAELERRGSPRGDLQAELYWYNDGYELAPAVSGLEILGASRPLLEYVIRRRVTALPNVGLRSPCEVTGLLTTPDRQRVTGVRLAGGEALDADLVVDAGGRGSRTPVWLAELGYPRPEEESVKIGVTYVTRYFRREPEHLDGNFGAGGGAFPGQPRSGGVFAQDGDRFALTLTGMFGEEPPTDEAGMAAYARTLAAPQVATVLTTAEPLTEPAKMRYPASTRRHYERLRRFPAGYLVVGDALCNFNPIYGQGMTVAALEALELRRLVAAGTENLSRRFFRRAATVIDNPWSIAVGADLRFPQTGVRRGLRARLIDAYLARFHRVAAVDPALGEAFLRVINMLATPASLFTPRLLWRVLRPVPATVQRPSRSRPDALKRARED